MPLRALLPVTLASLAAFALAAGATGANKPGDPCSKEGEIAELNGGKIQCVNGLWAPYAGAGPSQPGGGAERANSEKRITQID